jgi:hypothetical protein
MQIKSGGRYRSRVCDTELIVVRPLSGDVDLTCGGHPMIDQKAEVTPGLAFKEGADAGNALGKRYTDGSGKLELLVTKAGQGMLSLAEEPLVLEKPSLFRRATKRA